MKKTLTKEQIEKIGIEFIQKDDRYEMEEKYSQSTKYDYSEFCDCCGRGIKGEPKFFIHAILLVLNVVKNIQKNMFLTN